MTDTSTAFPGPGPGDPLAASAKPPGVRDRIIDATMELAAERDWKTFGVQAIATRAGVSLADFRDAFPSKGAVLAGWSRKIDRIVLDATTDDLAAESTKERLFDVLMRRLDAMLPYRLALDGIADWVKGDAPAAAALNGVALNSMRFMCAAAGVDVEGRTGTVKLQGLVLAWTRILAVWLDDNDPGFARTMAALDKELERGGTLARRVDEIDRAVEPLRLLGRAVMDSGRRLRERRRTDARPSTPPGDLDAADPAI